MVCLFVVVWVVCLFLFALFMDAFVNSVVHYDFFLFVVGCMLAGLAVGCLLCC